MSNKRWQQLGAAGGIAFVLLQLFSQSLIQVGGAEPPFAAPAEEIAAFFMQRSVLLFSSGSFLAALSSLALLWFGGVLWAELQRFEQKPGWIWVVSLASVAALAAVSMTGSGWELAVFRINDGLSPEIARTLFDQGNFMFATIWVIAANFLLASSVVGLKDKALPRWLSWLGLITAVGLIIARAFWASSGLAFVPYMLFWVWLIATSTVLMRRAGKTAVDQEDQKEIECSI